MTNTDVTFPFGYTFLDQVVSEECSMRPNLDFDRILHFAISSSESELDIRGELTLPLEPRLHECNHLHVAYSLHGKRLVSHLIKFYKDTVERSSVVGYVPEARIRRSGIREGSPSDFSCKRVQRPIFPERVYAQATGLFSTLLEEDILTPEKKEALSRLPIDKIQRRRYSPFVSDYSEEHLSQRDKVSLQNVRENTQEILLPFGKDALTYFLK